MNPLLLEDIARERIRELQRSRHPRIGTKRTLRERLTLHLRWSTTPTPAADRITIRLCGEDEAWAIERLAALEARPLPPGPLLIAEVGGQIEVALPIDGGEPLANPFRPTTHLISLLTLRRDQLGQAA